MNRILRSATMVFLLPALAGCSLLFVQKGGLSVSSRDAEAVPEAPSLAAGMESENRLKHVVKAGDTLERISRKYYGTGQCASAIAKANGMDLKAVLRVGRTLWLEPPSSVAPAEAAVNTGSPRVVERRAGDRVYVIEVSGAATKGRPKENRAFAKGEYLKFIVKFFAVTGGYATLEVRDLVKHEGRPCFKLVGTAKAAFPFSTVYTVDEYLESLFDAVDFFPWRFHKKVVEGGYRENTVTTYDPVRLKAVRVKNQEPPKEQAVPPFVQDIMSCFYYARLMKLEPGDRFAIPTHAGDKNYELVVEVLRRDTQRVQAGKFDCLVVKPHVKYDNVFQNKGDVLLWVTDDERHLPVLIRSKILVGNIDVELIEARLPKLQP